ncbi:hypothetical protein WISP_07679 [Willisornis vidua]|uniref:C2H2-type domain-containing protein n=1 Tax=Willisornis vidua TaxID=1566151 RepID=A0ABQ9DT33_9PASS|nr:hypothetical protein WISP_07679 [Willisornis vidua]
MAKKKKQFPVVCDICGREFAHGSDIKDLYNCKKCRTSFATLQEQRKNVHEAPSWEYNPCPTCSKIFSTPLLLECHWVTHIWGKPFTCGICDKAYQTNEACRFEDTEYHGVCPTVKNPKISTVAPILEPPIDKMGFPTHSSQLEQELRQIPPVLMSHELIDPVP